MAFPTEILYSGCLTGSGEAAKGVRNPPDPPCLRSPDRHDIRICVRIRAVVFSVIRMPRGCLVKVRVAQSLEELEFGVGKCFVIAFNDVIRPLACST